MGTEDITDLGIKTHTPCIYLPIVLAHLVLSREFGDLGEVIDVAQKKDRAKDLSLIHI